MAEKENENQAEPGHNRVDKKRLKGIFYRAQRISDDIAALQEDMSNLMTEAAGVGLSPKTIKALLKKQRMTDEQRIRQQEQQEQEDLYAHALGFEETPLGRAANDRFVAVTAHAVKEAKANEKKKKAEIEKSEDYGG